MRTQRSGRGRRVVPALLGLALPVVGAGIAALPTSSSAAPAERAPAATRAATAPACARPAGGFVPTRARIPAIERTLKVIQVKRKNGQVGAGPVTEQGKWLVAMDPHTKPGKGKGSVILSGHTWPDGSALGNALLRNLRAGDGFVLAGKDGKRACYRITARESYPVDDVPNKKAMRYWGPEQAVIVVCSGKRRGPGDWSRRTIWYAVPSVPAPAPPPPAPPTDDGSDGLLGGLFGGLLGGLLGGGN